MGTKPDGKSAAASDFNKKEASIMDVAREAGVSKTSVSNFLNGKDARLSEATKVRIREVAARLRYTPAIGARRLSNKSKSMTVGVVLRHDLSYTFHTQFFSHVMQGISETGTELGFRLLLVASSADRDADVAYCLSLAKGIVDGFLLFEIEDDDPYIAAFESKSVPFVSFGEPRDGRTRAWVASDQRGGTFEATRHLLSHGHRRIALFPGAESLLVSARRVEGYRQALTEAALDFDPSLVYYDIEAADRDGRLEAALRVDPAVDAFVVPHAAAASFAAAMETTGRAAKAPALVLADYFPASDYEPRGYSHIRSSPSDVGRAGMEMLAAIIDGHPPERGLVFPTRLVRGTSCGCLLPDGKPGVSDN